MSSTRYALAGFCLATLVTLASGCSIDIGGGGTTTEPVPTGLTGPGTPTTSPDELAQIETAVNRWHTDHGPNHRADEKLALTFAKLAPGVDFRCSKALASDTHQIAYAQLRGDPRQAVSICKRTASG